MSETKKRKLHSPEFKAKVGLEALRGIKTINEIGHEIWCSSRYGWAVEERNPRTRQDIV